MEHKRVGLITPPGPRLGKFLGLKFPRKHAHGGRRSIYAELNLTSMVDMLTILVVFLLQFFSASGELVTTSANLELQEAVHLVDLEPDALLRVTSTELFYSGKSQKKSIPVASLKDNKLQDLKAVLDRESLNNGGPQKDKHGAIKQPTINVAIDKNVPFSLTRRVMLVCNESGFVYKFVSAPKSQKTK